MRYKRKVKLRQKHKWNHETRNNLLKLLWHDIDNREYVYVSHEWFFAGGKKREVPISKPI